MVGDDYRTRRLLAKIYASQFLTDSDSLDYLRTNLEVDSEGLLRELERLRDSNLVFIGGSRPRLTGKGRKLITVVMTGGGFDIIHPGHVETLESARALGDVLIVSVARNSTFERNKKRKPIHDEKVRKKIVSSMRVVDAAVLGSESDIFETVQLIKPDIIALGYDQAHSEEGIKTEVSKRGLRLKVVRLQSSVPEIKTSKITESVKDLWNDT